MNRERKFKGWAVLHLEKPMWWTAGNSRQNAYDIAKNYPKHATKVIRVYVDIIERKKK